MKKKKNFMLFCIVLCAAVFAVLFLLYGKPLYAFVSDTKQFKAWIRSLGGWGEITFVALRALQTVIKLIPGEPLEIAAGYAFGIWKGLLLCMIGTLIGSFLILLIAKTWGTKLAELFISPKKRSSLAFLQDTKRLSTTLFIIYLVPSTPKDLITYFIIFTPMKISVFLLITTPARIPSIVTSTWCGAALGEKKLIWAITIYLLTFLLGMAVLFLFRKRQKEK